MRSERLQLLPFTPEETREIVFKTMLYGEQHHTVRLDGAGLLGDGRSACTAFFARQSPKELRLVGGYDVLYGQVKAFVRERLFDGPECDRDHPVLRNLSESTVLEARLRATPTERVDDINMPANRYPPLPAQHAWRHQQ